MVNDNMLDAYLEHMRSLNNIAENLTNFLTATNSDFNRIMAPYLQTTTSRRRTTTTARNRFNDVFTTGFLDFMPQMTTTTLSPTVNQILNATEQVLYSEIENPVHTRCPITMAEFNDDDTVIRIRHCGHYFEERAIMRWFSNHITCPVCRHNITNITNTNIGPANNTATSSPNNSTSTGVSNSIPTTSQPRIGTNITNEMAQGIMTNLTNLINTNSNNSLDSFIDPSGNLNISYIRY